MRRSIDSRVKARGRPQPTATQQAARVKLLRELARWKATGALFECDLAPYPLTSALLETAKRVHAARLRKFVHQGYRYELVFSNLGLVIVLDDGAPLDAGLVAWQEPRDESAA